MKFKESIKKNFFNCSGVERASRSEYFFYFHFFLVMYFIFVFLKDFVSVSFPKSSALSGSITVAYVLFLFLQIVPIFSLTFKRLHDLNLSGWWILIMPAILFVLWEVYPVLGLLGSIAHYVLLNCVRGTKGPNKYGNDPLIKVSA